ncbi:MAG: dihydrolipoyl dehydrogenase [Bacillota bacterium]
MATGVGCQRATMADYGPILVIGGGVGGYVAAVKAAQLGAQVTLVEQDRLGGTCLNRGCIPTKALLKSAELVDSLGKAASMGVMVDGFKIDFSRMIARKNQVVTRLVKGVEYLMSTNKINVIKGKARFTADKRVEVTCADGQVQTLEPVKIIIASGSEPARLPVPGADGCRVITSDEALDLKEVPSSLLIIGGGAIGVEFASIFSTLGSKVTLVEMMPRLLPAMDEEVVGVLEKNLMKKGVKCITGARILSISDGESQDEKVVQLSKDGQEQSITASLVLVAAGRKPYTQGLGLENTSIKIDKGKILVNGKMETNTPGVYAVGDVTGGILLAHVAAAQGIVAAVNAMGSCQEVDLRFVPGCIYTSPEVAGVGLTEKEAKEQGRKVKVGKFPYSANGKAIAMGENEGMVKLVCDEQFGEILGAHIVGPRATDLIAELTLAMQAELTAEEIAHTIHAHPTLAEAIMEAAHGVVGKAIHI